MPRSRFPNRTLALAGIGLSAAAACSPAETGVVQNNPGDPVIVLSEGACFGTCPIYDMTLRPDGRFTLFGERFVKDTGVQEGTLGPEAWDKAVTALEGGDFWSVEANQTPATLQNCHTDAPTAKITWRTEEGREKTLTYDAGCGVRKTQDLVIALRDALHFEDLVWTDRQFPFDPGSPR